jgi:hypothetical protein
VRKFADGLPEVRGWQNESLIPELEKTRRAKRLFFRRLIFFTRSWRERPTIAFLQHLEFLHAAHAQGLMADLLKASPARAREERGLSNDVSYAAAKSAVNR